MATLPVYLKERDAEKLLKTTFRKRTAKNDRNQLIIRLFLATGLRRAELVNLQVEDVDFEERLIYVRKGKGLKDRIVFVNPDTLRVLHRFLGDRKSGTIFNISKYRAWQIVKAMAKTAGVPSADKISPHKLRHTFAINWIQHGGDVESLRRLLGHSSLVATQIYLNFDFAYLRQAYDRLHNTQQQRRLIR